MMSLIDQKKRAEEVVKESVIASHELMDAGEKPNEYVKMRRELDGWGDVEQRAFWATYINVADQRNSPKGQKAQRDKKAIESYAEELSTHPPLLRDILVGIDQGRRDIQSLGARVFGKGDAADSMNKEAELAEQARAQAAEKDSAPDWLQTGASGAARSMFTASAMSPLGGYGIIGGFAASRANQAITESEEAGLKGRDKWGYIGRAAAIEGGIAGAFQLVGAGGFEKLMGGGGLSRPGFKAFLKQTGVSMLQELPEENITEILDEYNQIVSKIAPGELTKERVGRILLDTTVQTLLTIGATTSYQGATQQDALKMRKQLVDGMMSQYGFDEKTADAIYERAQKGKGDFAENLGRELTEEHVVNDGLEAWARACPDEAQALSEIDKPTRKDFENAGLPRRPAKVRRRVAADLKEIVPLLNDSSDSTNGTPPPPSDSAESSDQKAAQGEGIKNTFHKMGTEAARSNHKEALKRFKDGTRTKLTKPAAIEAAKQSPWMNMADDGSILGMMDLDTNEWIGQAPHKSQPSKQPSGPHKSEKPVQVDPPNIKLRKQDVGHDANGDAITYEECVKDTGKLKHLTLDELKAVSDLGVEIEEADQQDDNYDARGIDVDAETETDRIVDHYVSVREGIQNNEPIDLSELKGLGLEIPDGWVEKDGVVMTKEDADAEIEAEEAAKTEREIAAKKAKEGAKEEAEKEAKEGAKEEAAKKAKEEAEKEAKEGAKEGADTVSERERLERELARLAADAEGIKPFSDEDLANMDAQSRIKKRMAELGDSQSVTGEQPSEPKPERTSDEKEAKEGAKKGAEEREAEMEAELASMSDDEFDSLFDEAVAEETKSSTPNTPPNTPPKLMQRKVGRKGVKRKAPSTGTAKPKSKGKKIAPPAVAETRTPDDIIKDAAKHGVKGIEESVKALHELFGGSTKGKLGMGVPLDIDQDTYRKAKPHFEAALKEFAAAGKDMKEYFRWAVSSFGTNVKPYLKQFKVDLENKAAEGKDKNKEQGNADRKSNKEGSTSEVHADDSGGVDKAGSSDGAMSEGSRGKTDTDSRPDGDVQPTESTDSDGVSGTGVSAEAVGVGGQSATDGGGKDISGSGKHGMVPETSVNGDHGTGGKTSVDGSDDLRRGNYDLRDKPLIRLTKKVRKEINKKVKELLGQSEFTDEDLETLRQYTGEGGLSSGSKEALNQHYTDYSTIRAMFKALRDAGVKLTNLLEPGVGAGNFVGHAPEANWTTVDIDETNHRVVKALYPDGKHYNVSFEEFTAGGFDAVISNVPFLETRGAGRKKARSDIKALHDFYFAHALDRVKPNGVIAFVTSTGTMDKVDSKIREEIISKADVIGCYRLPGGHFSKNAHTDVITDVIFLQRRPDGVSARSEAAKRNDLFTRSTKTSDDIALNEWYQAHPDAVLGDMVAGVNKMYGGRPAYEVKGEARLNEMAIDYKPYGNDPAPQGKKTGKKGKTKKVEKTIPDAPTDSIEFAKWADEYGIVTRNSGGRRYNENILIQDGAVYALSEEVMFDDIDASAKVYKPVPRATAEKILKLDAIRQLATDFQDGSAEAGIEGINAVDEYRSEHNTHPAKDRSLRSFFKKHGEETYLAELGAAFTDDMHAADVFYDQTRHSDGGKITATKDDSLLSQAAAAENNKGIIEFPTDQGFVTEDDAIDLLEAGYALAGYEPKMEDTGRLYSEIVPNEYYVLGWAGVETFAGQTIYSAENSKTGEKTPDFETKEEVAGWLKKNATAADLGKPRISLQNDILYYSGNIYEKLRHLKQLRKTVPPEYLPALDKQEAKLQEIIPAPKPLEEINIKGSEKWLAPFISQCGIGITSSINDDTGLREYDVNWSYLTPEQSKALERHLNNKALVTRKSQDGFKESMGSYMLRMREAENDLRDALEHIKNALMANESMREKVEHAYNSRYRNYVKPNYEKAQYLIQDVLDEIADNAPMVRDAKTGKMRPLTLRKNQIAWVIQALYEGRGINAHDVGGGKTMAAIVLARALKRRGRAQKPMLVVPAKTIKKWVKETRLLFPDAKIVDLGALTIGKREKALFNLANNNADYIFISHEGFGKIKLPTDDEIGYVQDVVNEHVDDPNASGRQEALITQKMEEYIDILQNETRNTRLTWDKLGIDCVIADEAHAFKNIGINNQLVRFGLGKAFGFNKQGTALKSARSYDFRFKANYTADRNNGGNVFLLTATPTPNKPMEIYTMLRHFGNDVFAEYGIENDRDFASTFFHLGTVNDQSKGNPKSILRAIVNAQELRGLLNRYVDKLSMEDMPWITVPAARESRVFIDQSAQYALVAEDLIRRQENLPPHPTEGDDTLVAIYTGGRSASVDARLYGGKHASVAIDMRSFDKNDDKVQYTVERVIEVAEGNSNVGQLIFLDDSGHSQAERGAISMNVHSEIKAELIARGLNPKQIAIINGKEITNPATGKETGAGTNADVKKAAIQDAYNAGDIKVVIGSTTSMGEGMDLQVKTTDIYHLDIPYTPGAFRQRNGRGVRPGNENDVVDIHYMMMRGSFDAMSLNIVMTKKGWNEAIWDKDVADTISTEEEMTAGVIPNNKQILMELEKDPIKRKTMEVQYMLDSMYAQLNGWKDEHYALRTRKRSKERQIGALQREQSARRQRIAELEPDTRIKNEKKRAEQFEKSKAYAKKLLEVSERRIQEQLDSIEKIESGIQDLTEQIKTLNGDIAAYTERWMDEQGDIHVTDADIETDEGASDDSLGFAPRSNSNAGAGGTGRGGVRQSQVGQEGKQSNVQAHDIINAIKRLFPNVSVKGAVTFKKKALGWYSPGLKEIRMKDVRDISVAMHELGHHFDFQMGVWSKSKGLPRGIPTELAKLGRDLYGDRKPVAGYRAEGFAEFMREFLTGGDIQKRAPRLYEWFTTEYLPANPSDAKKKLRKIEQLITAYRTQTPEQTVRNFRQPIKQDWSPARTVSRFARWFDLKWRDTNLAIIHAMKAAGIDYNKLDADQNPYMLATAYSMSAPGKAYHAALVEATDMSGNKIGVSLKDALAPVSSLGQEALEQWTDYAIARRAIDLAERGINPGISMQDAQAVVDKYHSANFGKVLNAVTDWSRTQMRLLVETGAMTVKEYNDIVDLNPVYVPFSRQFDKNELRPGRIGRTGRGIHRIKGSGREIHNPIDALIMQAEKITQAAMQADVLRAMVNLYDASKQLKDGSTGHFMSEIPAPQVATTFSAEKIKKEMATKAVELGADPEEVAAAMLEAWTENITVFTQGKEFKGKEHVVSVVLRGERRFFEVSRDMYAMLEGLNKGAILTGAIGKVSRAAVGLQRLGATGLNPAFGLVRNFLRDAGTTAITYDYAKGGPLAGLAGIAEDITGGTNERRYHALGVDLAQWIGHNRRSVKGVSRKVSAGTKGRKAFVTITDPIQALRTVFGITEAGPRLAEFKAAYNYAIEQGQSKKAAAITASVAAKDVSVNFSRAGEYGRAMNEVVLFFNAAVQSVDKFGRTVQDHPIRTVGRGVGYLTFMSLLAYYRNRDKEWWKELPPHEKWSYVHWELPGDHILRVPLPFEFGILFGALPAAAIESTRSPGAFSEAFGQLTKTIRPSAMPGVLSPIFDVARNKDWKGSSIIPPNIKRSRMPADQYTSQTTGLAKGVGEMMGVSPAIIEHLVNSYTGGLYRRVAGMLGIMVNPSKIGANGDWSSIPVAGALFMRHGTSRVAGDFYDRLDYLRQVKGSGKASLAEIGELAEAEKLSREAQEMWAARREIIASQKSPDEIKRETDSILDEIHGKFRTHQKQSTAYFITRGEGSIIYAATSPAADAEVRGNAKDLLAGKSDTELIRALRSETMRRYNNATPYTSTGKLTSYGKRVARLRSLDL